MAPQAVQEDRAGDAGTCSPLLERLIGRSLPPIALPSTIDGPVDLATVDRAVLYLYPANRCSPEDGYDSPALDEAQHRTFSDHWSDFLALNCMVLGLSSHSVDEQRHIASALGIGHPLLCDIDARVASDLGVPTFSVDNVAWYCRVTLIIDDGTIAQAFYPLVSAVRSAKQAVAWMRRERWN